MQPTHIDDLLGGTWQWELDEDDAYPGDDFEAMLDELAEMLVPA